MDFVRSVDRCVILEELEPVIETDVRALAHKASVDTRIIGKGEVLPRAGEYSVDTVRKALHVVLEDGPAPALEHCEPAQDLPMRPPNLCAGCSHRSVYYAVRQVFGDDAVYSSDIGCYTLGILPPLSAADFLLCMGSSISAGTGMARADKRPVVAFIGDSTFFHSGITGIVNAVFNRHDVLVVVLDNRTTAMTGHQPHPGVDCELMGGCHTQVDIEAVVRGCGVTQVQKVRSYNVKKVAAALEELKAQKGVRVLITEEPCVLFARRAMKKTSGQVAYVAEQGADVENCLKTLACPAFYRDGEEIAIDPNQCSGCMVCLQAAENIKARKRS
jgi:indolepyruvate ferredoxin oxidoreductase alpha subunit